MGQESKWVKSQDGPRVKIGCCCLPSERVELTVNINKETNGRVKMSQTVIMGQGSRWAAVVYPLKELNNSEQQERNKWQGPNLPRLKMGQESN